MPQAHHPRPPGVACHFFHGSLLAPTFLHTATDHDVTDGPYDDATGKEGQEKAFTKGTGEVIELGGGVCGGGIRNSVYVYGSFVTTLLAQVSGVQTARPT